MVGPFAWDHPGGSGCGLGQTNEPLVRNDWAGSNKFEVNVPDLSSLYSDAHRIKKIQQVLYLFFQTLSLTLTAWEFKKPFL
jgi:hypothetical protein